MKKLLALLLALVMIFALAACGESDKKDDDKETQGTTLAPATTIVGSWKYDISMSGESMGYEGVKATIDLQVQQTFKEDGTVTMVVNEDKLLASMPAFEEALVNYMIENYYEGDESVRSAVEEMVAGMNMGATMMESFNSIQATYTVEGDKLTITGQIDADVEVPTEEYTFKFVSNTVELYAANANTEEAFAMYGVDKLVLNPA